MRPSPDSSPEEMIAYWQTLVEPESEKPWDEDSVNFLFHQFRPDGVGVEKVFEGCIRGGEILPRLVEVYRRTAEGSVRGGSSDGYFIVRKPEPLPPSEASALCAKHLLNMKALMISFLAGDEEILEFVSEAFETMPQVEVTKGSPYDFPVGWDSPDATLYSTICDLAIDWRHQWEHVQSHAFLLDDAFYYLACDYRLKLHLMWPLFRDLTDIEEPFAPYFELWKHGAGYRFTGDHHVTVYVPNLLT